MPRKKPFKRLQINRLSTRIIPMVESRLVCSILCIVSILNSRIGIREAIQQRRLDIAN